MEDFYQQNKFKFTEQKYNIYNILYLNILKENEST